MKRLKAYSFKKYHLILFFAFFSFGFIWGKYFYYSHQQPLEVFVKREIKVLAPQGSITDDILETYHLEYQTQISLSNYANTEELKTALKTKTYDVVLAATEDSKDLLLQEKLQALDSKRIKNKKFISPDFSSLPYDKELKFLIPIFWGIDGIEIKIRDAQHVDVTVSPEGAKLWTTNIGVLKSSQNAKLAYDFIDFLLQKEVVLALVNHRQVATTHRELDKENIQANLKSSFIRQVSLKYLRY